MLKTLQYSCVIITVPTIILALSVTLNSKFPVTMAGLFASNFSSRYSLPYTGPAVDAALEDVEKEFPNLTVHFEIIKRHDVRSCMETIDNTDLVSEYYYRGWNGSGVFLIMQTGKCH